jgi:eukaryotic-like serine/threonine-protein kinase
VSAPQLAPGAVVGGKYSIRSVLGYGGATATFAAAAGTGREVVVRVLSQQLAQRGDVLASLQQAATFTSSLPADTSAPILESGFDPQTGAPYTVTELVVLPSLARAAQSGPLAVADVVLILQAIARAVDAAHAQRIAHGGLKPQNVFIGPAPQKSVRVIDFGMALVRAALPTNEGRSNAAPWIAPEQLQGGPPGPASDVFSAALVAFFAATGKSYWQSCQGPAAPDLGGLQKELAGARVPASARARELGASLSAGFDPILGRALALNPAERFTSLSELAEAVAKGGGPQKMAMTMPLNAMPFAAQEALRKASAAQPAAPQAAAQAPVGGDTLAIQSPLEATQWAPQAALQAAAAPQPQPSQQPATQAVPQQSMPQPMQQPAQPQMPMQQPMNMGMQQPIAPQMQQPPPGAPILTPLGGFQGGFQPPPGQAGPVQAQASYGPPPESSVVVPKSRAGLIIGIVLAVVFIAGGAIGAVFYVRARAAATAAEDPTPAATQPAAPANSAPAAAAPPPAASPGAAAAAPAPAEAHDAEAPGQATPEAAAPSQAPDAAAPEQAVVSIVCTPECDSIKIDDKALENEADASLFPSPEPVNLSPGPHTIVVGRATFLPQTKKVTVKAGQKEKLAFFLTKPGPAVVPTKQCGKFLERCP